ncbi:iron-sulfur cluster repair protein YtfE [Litchfieldella xinjiangensis]|uniref:iron-sulfur cluster repair protein YtfE n=1 Tax=Litchfieldella xinjiangensis TaxID=1166948 RepID=UPI0005BBFCF9|nr:iron-sulfur cluster repair protein YtfE [Halomonas xinjiangensis]
MTLLDHPVGRLARDLPGATRLFHAHGIDFCCGGRATLRESLAQRAIAEDDPVAAQLLEALATLPAQTADNRDWRLASPSELIDHILTRYHQVHRQQLPELTRLARRVELVHGERPTCPHGLADHLETMRQELESHMQKEEQVLFPMLRRGLFGPAQGPIAVMRHEHDDHGDALEALMTLTNDMTPPKGACNTWRALFAGLRELREDLMEHIHLENNVLFGISAAPDAVEVQHG